MRRFTVFPSYENKTLATYKHVINYFNKLSRKVSQVFIFTFTFLLSNNLIFIKIQVLGD